MTRTAVVEPAVEPAPSRAASSRSGVAAWGRAHARLVGGLVVAVVVLLGHGIVVLHNRRFYFQDDTQAYYAPVWQELGRRLRSGELPVLSPDQWMAGNFLIETQVGLWNPVQLLVNLLAPSVPRMAVMSALVGIGFAVLLGLGVYRVALAHGAQVHWAVVAGTAAPFAGWTLWYDTGSWMISLMCTAFVAHAWASLVRLAAGTSGPLPAFAWLYLDLSTGYPYGAFAAGLVTLAVLVGVLARRGGRTPLVRVALTGVAAVLCGAITILPNYLSYDVTFRVTFEETFSSDGFLVLPWSESLGAGIPTYLPQMTGFLGAEKVPSTWIAWFLLPALAFVDWSALRRRVVGLAGPLSLVVLMLVVTAGPGYAGPLRWPARFMPYLAIALLVVFAVAASHALTTARWRLRAGVAAGLVVLCALRAASITAPRLAVEHVLATLLVLALGVLAALVWRWRGERFTAGLLALSVLPVVLFQLQSFPSNLNWADWGMPSDLEAAREIFPDRPGSTLQLGDRALVDFPERSVERAWSEVAASSFARGADRNYVNAYTPVGFHAFRELLCMNHIGDTCPDARDRLFRTEPRTGMTYAELMNVQRVVLQRVQYPTAHVDPVPVGWRRTEIDDYVVVLERAGSTARRAGGVTAAVDADVEVQEQSGREVRGSVSSADGGQLVLSRLAWPGYQAFVDDRPVEVGALDDVFLTVDVPPGTQDAAFEVRYVPPGWRLGAGLAALGLALVGGLAGQQARSRRRRPLHGPEREPRR